MNSYEWYKIKSEERAKRILELEEEIASLQEAAADMHAAAEAQSETIGRRTNALRRIGEICSDGGVTTEVKLSSIRFIVKEALKPLSLFNFEEAAQAQSAEGE